MSEREVREFYFYLPFYADEKEMLVHRNLNSDRELGLNIIHSSGRNGLIK